MSSENNEIPINDGNTIDAASSISRYIHILNSSEYGISRSVRQGVADQYLRKSIEALLSPDEEVIEPEMPTMPSQKSLQLAEEAEEYKRNYRGSIEAVKQASGLLPEADVRDGNNEEKVVPDKKLRFSTLSKIAQTAFSSLVSYSSVKKAEIKDGFKEKKNSALDRYDNLYFGIYDAVINAKTSATNAKWALQEYAYKHESTKGLKIAKGATMLGGLAVAAFMFVDQTKNGGMLSTHFNHASSHEAMQQMHFFPVTEKVQALTSNITKIKHLGHASLGHVLTLNSPGSSIESSEINYLKSIGLKPNNSNIYNLTDKVLHNLHLNWNTAKDLPKGFKFHLPPMHTLMTIFKS